MFDKKAFSLHFVQGLSAQKDKLATKKISSGSQKIREIMKAKEEMLLRTTVANIAKESLELILK